MDWLVGRRARPPAAEREACRDLLEESEAARPDEGDHLNGPVARSRPRLGRAVLFVAGGVATASLVCAVAAAATSRLRGSRRPLGGPATALVDGRTSLFQAGDGSDHAAAGASMFDHIGGLLEAEAEQDQLHSGSAGAASSAGTSAQQHHHHHAASTAHDHHHATTVAHHGHHAGGGGVHAASTITETTTATETTQSLMPENWTVGTIAEATTTEPAPAPEESETLTKRTATATQTHEPEIEIVFPGALLPTTTLRSTPPPSLPAVCSFCSPRVRDKLTVVVPVWEKDLCKLKVTARSIDVHDPNGYLGDLVVVWVSHKPASDYQDELDEIRALVKPARRMEVYELSIPESGSGWYVQQSAKLKVASLITTTYYLVIDAKNALIRAVEPNSFLDECNLGKIFGRYAMDGMPGLHHEWYQHSASVLGTTLMDQDMWPASITPVVMHRETVLDLLESLGEPKDQLDTCTGGLCDAFDKGATEFTLYLVYAGQNACIHSHEDGLTDEIATSIWRGDPKDDAFQKMMLNQLHAVAKGDKKPLMFGAQAGALGSVSGQTRYKALKDLYEIYLSAELFDFKDWDELADCVMGSGS